MRLKVPGPAEIATRRNKKRKKERRKKKSTGLENQSWREGTNFEVAGPLFFFVRARKKNWYFFGILCAKFRSEIGG